MFNVRDSKPVWNDTHTAKRSAKFITQTRQPNTTKSSLQNSRLRLRRPGTRFKKPCGDLNTDGFTSNLGSLVKDGHLNPCFRLGTFWAVGLIWDKLPLLLSAQAFQPFNWLSHSYLEVFSFCIWKALTTSGEWELKLEIFKIYLDTS